VALEWGLPDLAEPAELLASELMTNAVQASERLRITGDSPAVPVVRLWLVSDQASIVIHVWDGIDEMPVRRDGGPDEEHGRGLLLVNALSTDWGAYRKAHGKVVWVMVGLKDRPLTPRPAE
jgi:anti-sigma regulatory factor (Ser/Thr protein kinase)